MPINKSARFRFEIIDECLRNTKKKWSKTDLLTFVNRRLALHFGEGTTISASQLRYDLENMQSEYGAPIEMYKEGRNHYYRYDDPDFSLKTLPLNEEDLIKLNTAVSILTQLKGFTLAEEIAEVVTRLESRYKFVNPQEQKIIIFDNAPVTSGLENLEDIYHAIIRKNALKITYHAFQSKKDREWNVHPYVLKEYNNRWYLFGFCEEMKGLRVYALDRMKTIKISKIPYNANSLIDLEEYFKDIIGITKPLDQAVEQIDLMFTSEMAPYTLTKPLHQSQQIVERYADGSLHVRIDVLINPELISLLLSYGKNVKVIGPEKLTLEMHTAAQLLLNNYES